MFCCPYLLSLTRTILCFSIFSMFIGLANPTNFSMFTHSVAAQDAAADPAADEPAGDAADEKAAKAPKKEENALQWLVGSLGWTYVIAFLILSFSLVALVVMNIISSRREHICPSQLVEGFESNLNEKKYQEAYDLAKTDNSFLGNVLSAGLAKLSAGYQQALESMQEVSEEETMKLNHSLSYISLIGAISPLVGLLGTVDGMIRAFYLIATSGSTPEASELAKGISTALVTTLVGLLLAIPAIIVYNVLRNIIDRRILEVGIICESLMSRFEKMGQTK
jgi:biopolymer transport protein ExbB